MRGFYLLQHHRKLFEQTLQLCEKSRLKKYKYCTLQGLRSLETARWDFISQTATEKTVSNIAQTTTPKPQSQSPSPRHEVLQTNSVLSIQVIFGHTTPSYTQRFKI